MARTVAEIAAEAEALRKTGTAEPDDDVVTDDEEEGGEGKEESASGFLSYEEYIKAGKDPDLYKGKKAWEEKQALLEANKALKKDFRQLSETVTSTMDEWRSNERAKMKSELETELAQAKADGDVNKVLEVKDKLTEIKTEEKRGTAPKLLPVIEDYIQDNSVIDAESKDFDQDVFEDFKALYDAQVTKLTAGTGVGLTERQIQRALGRALDEAKEMNKVTTQPQRSPRNDRQGTGRTPKGPDNKGQSIEVRLKNLKFDDNRNSENNPHPAYSIYKKMKETNPKAAEQFARRTLGDA